MATEPTHKNPESQPSPLTDDERALGMVLDAGEPFTSKRKGAAKLQELGIGEGWEVCEYGTGFAIMRKVSVTEPAEEPEEATAPEPEKRAPEFYKWVRFHSKSNPMDPDEVVLSVNGDVLQIRRNERIPLPQRFMECADHCRYRHFSQEPGKDRKVDREIHKYPFDILGDCTREEFVRWKRMGTKATREHAERVGIPLEA